MDNLWLVMIGIGIGMFLAYTFIVLFFKGASERHYDYAEKVDSMKPYGCYGASKHPECGHKRCINWATTARK